MVGYKGLGDVGGVELLSEEIGLFVRFGRNLLSKVNDGQA